METITQSAQETQSLGQKIGSSLKGGEIIALKGELGSGKTTFVQGLAKGLGIDQRIISPTFILIRSYQAKKNLTFFHLDLYRFEDRAEKEVKELGLEEIWSDPKNILAIEWAEKIEEILPKKTIEVNFEYLAEEKRRITIKK